MKTSLKKIIQFLAHIKYIAKNKKVSFLGWERFMENVHIVEGLIC